MSPYAPILGHGTTPACARASSYTDAMATLPVPSQSSPLAVRSHRLAYLRLFRPANLVTAAADIFTAAVIVHLHDARLAFLVGSSVLLYAGGVVLNDVCDRHLDAIERPERPLPSGAASAPVAGALGAASLLLGVLLAFCVSSLSGTVAALLAAAVLLYDAVAKPTPAGPVVMGSCRALNLLLGLSVAPALLPHTWFLVFLPFAYILGITTLSRGEVHGGTRAASGFTGALFAAILLGLGLLAAHSRHGGAAMLPFALLLLARVGPPLWRAFLTPDAAPIRAAVHAGIISLVVLDAALAASFGSLVLGAAILSLTVFTAELAKLFPVT